MKKRGSLANSNSFEIKKMQSNLVNNESLTNIQNQFQVKENKVKKTPEIKLYTDLLNQGLQYNEIMDLVNTLNKKTPIINEIKIMEIKSFNIFNETKSHQIIDKKFEAKEAKKYLKKSFVDTSAKSNQINIYSNINLTKHYNQQFQISNPRDNKIKINKKNNFREFLLNQEKFVNQKNKKIQKFKEILEKKIEENETFIPKINKRSGSLGYTEVTKDMHSSKSNKGISNFFCSVKQSQFNATNLTFHPKISGKSQKLNRNYKMLYEDYMNKAVTMEKKASASVKGLIDTANKCFTLKMSEKQNLISLLNKLESSIYIMTRKEMKEILFNLSLIESNDNEEVNLLFEILKDQKNLVKKEHLAIALIVILKINYPNIKLTNSDSKSPQIKSSSKQMGK